MARRRAKALPKGKEEDVRTMAGLITAGIISLVVVISVILAPIPQVGPDEGNQAPNFVADSYNGASWSEYRLSDNYDWDWNGTSDSKWIMIYFMDTDCPYCWVDGDEMSQLHSQWSDRVNFVTVAAELGISGHDSTRAEIEAFRDKTSYFGCNSDRDDCIDRPGTPNNWPYVDDRSMSIMNQWGLSGTPVSFILEPDGTVAWNKNKHQGQGGDGEELSAALQRLVGDQ